MVYVCTSTQLVKTFLQLKPTFESTLQRYFYSALRFYLSKLAATVFEGGRSRWQAETVASFEA